MTIQQLQAEIKITRQAIAESTSNIEIERLEIQLANQLQQLRRLAWGK